MLYEVITDYMRPPLRLAAMMGLAPVYVFTHDSVGLGEDGPTHHRITSYNVCYTKLLRARAPLPHHLAAGGGRGLIPRGVWPTGPAR